MQQRPKGREIPHSEEAERGFFEFDFATADGHVEQVERSGDSGPFLQPSASTDFRDTAPNV